MKSNPKTRKFETFEACLTECARDEAVRKSLAESAAEGFTDALRSIITERQLIAADYANAYRFFREGSNLAEAFKAENRLACATHDFCDPNPLMLAAIDDAVWSRIEAAAGSGDRMIVDPDRNLLDHVVAQDGDVGTGAALIWNSAWKIASDRGFSTLWAVKDGVPAEADFKTLAEFVMTPPASGDLSRYPDRPIFFEDDIDFETAVSAFMRAVVPFNPASAYEAASVLGNLLDDEDFDRVMEYLTSFELAAPSAPGPRR